MNEFEAKGLMSKDSPWGEFPNSRDFGLNIVCKFQQCPMNSQTGFCVSPTVVEVNLAGQCIHAKATLDEQKQK